PLTIAARLVGLGAMMWLLYAQPLAVLSSAVVTTLVAVGYALIFLRSERSREAVLAVLYAWYAMVALPWVQPWATLTVRRNGWLTRG
ncbi:MAG: hypothetical protein VX938_07655, partial [Myxococcota bacterium]|nr:hypothetical protein [Myxococcota bacterium]